MWSGEGNPGSLLQLDIDLSGEPNQAIECRANGLYGERCEVSAVACNGVKIAPQDGGNWTHQIDGQAFASTQPGGFAFLDAGFAGAISEELYQSASIGVTLDGCVPSMVFYKIQLGSVRAEGGGTTRWELQDTASINNGPFSTIGFAVWDNSLTGSFGDYGFYPDLDGSTLGLATASGSSFNLSFRREVLLTLPFGGFGSGNIEFAPTIIEMRFLAISGT
ncbi:MAG TPA: hypothetical protein VMW08_00170 [Acidimicrobiales bacterium]|nr:hypothetical protein [Acidimicrobiales bacterium]